MTHIIVPTKKSRPVELRDLWRVLCAAQKIKWAMRKPFPGRFPWASSISHCQIEENDPLRFFVVDREGGLNEQGVRLRQGTPLKRYFGARTIINPIITKTGKEIMNSREGCMSFASEKIRKIKRLENVFVSYWTFFGPRIRKFSLYRASIVQHEIDHMDLVNIHDRYFHRRGKGLY